MLFKILTREMVRLLCKQGRKKKPAKNPQHNKQMEIWPDENKHNR